MDTYSAVFSYFKKVDKAIKYSNNGDETLIGIRNVSSGLISSLNLLGDPPQVVFSFVLDGEIVYYHRGYSTSFHNNKIPNLFSWRGAPTELKYDFKVKAKDLIPYEVYVTINGVECTYGIVDFILLDGFLDGCEKTNTSENPPKSEEDKRDKN